MNARDLLRSVTLRRPKVRLKLVAALAFVAQLGIVAIPAIHLATAHACAKEVQAGVRAGPAACLVCWHLANGLGTGEIATAPTLTDTREALLVAPSVVATSFLVAATATARAPPP